jgi:hypothetical protein
MVPLLATLTAVSQLCFEICESASYCYSLLFIDILEAELWAEATFACSQRELEQVASFQEFGSQCTCWGE